jgi:signal transduction histidine kinase
MKYSEIIPFFAAVVNMVLAVLVFSRNRRNPINQIYFFFGTCIAIWNYGAYTLFQISFTEESRATAAFWARMLEAGVIFMPVLWFHLCFLSIREAVGRKIVALYCLHVLFSLTNLTTLFVKDVHLVRDSKGVAFSWYATGGPVFFLFFAEYALVSNYTFRLLRKKFATAERTALTRLKLLLVVNVMMIVFGANDLMPILGISFYPFTHIPIYPLASLAAIPYGIMIAYSILQHQLLDIHITLGRVVAHAVRILFMILIAGLLMLIAHSMFPDVLSRPGMGISLVVLVISAFASSIFFPRLFSSGSDALERRILGDRFEYHDKVKNFIQSLPWHTDTKSLMDEFNELLMKTVKVQNYTIVLLDEAVRKFVVYRSFPENTAHLPLNLDRDSPVFQFFHTTKEDMLALNPDYKKSEEGDLERMACEKLTQFNAELCYSFFSEEDPVGLLLLGEKKDGDLYTSHEMHLMRDVVKNLSLIMNQIRLKQKVLVSEEMELLGRMSQGMAHDLNNLITPVWTYVQLAGESAHHEDPSYELLPTAKRNVETIQAYIKESLFYSNTLKPHFVMARLDQNVDLSIKLVTPQLRERSIDIVCEPLPEISVEHDSILIQRMVCNLLSNAGDASPNGSTVHINLTRLPSTETHRDWFRLQVIDQGSGISKDNLSKVFQPYFTTKNRGSGKRGFGLGLAICRKIVVLHGGSLNIASEEKKGTTIIVDLPSRVETSVDKTKTILSHAQAA